MHISPEEARTLLSCADPGRLRWGWPIGLRDCAVLALIAAGLSAAEVSHLQASAITMDRGQLLVQIQRRDILQPFPLPVDLGARLLAWLSERRLWAAAVPVFDSLQGPLTTNAVYQILHRYRHPRPPKRKNHSPKRN
jgi:hypothetical protein